MAGINKWGAHAPRLFIIIIYDLGPINWSALNRNAQHIFGFITVSFDRSVKDIAAFYYQIHRISVMFTDKFI